MPDQARPDEPSISARVPHQLIFEKHHHNVNDVVVAYVNYLETRCSMFEREMTASHEREMHNHHAESEQMKDVRNKNTELEIKNRELDRQQALINEMATLINILQTKPGMHPQAAEPVLNEPHPWDLFVRPTGDNPLGISARELVNNLRASVQDLTRERESLIEDARRLRQQLSSTFNGINSFTASGA